ncbi:MAG TPA: hypothetical protein PL110_11820 [Candidatus Eremiobacteraeota bacterium]|nr:hypothetical protein [Candidatus Eremiobacteraeota bacterium]
MARAALRYAIEKLPLEMRKEAMRKEALTSTAFLFFRLSNIKTFI